MRDGSLEVGNLHTQKDIVDETSLAHTRGERYDRAVRGQFQLDECERIRDRHVFHCHPRLRFDDFLDACAQALGVTLAARPRAARREEAARQNARGRALRWCEVGVARGHREAVLLPNDRTPDDLDRGVSLARHRLDDAQLLESFWPKYATSGRTISNSLATTVATPAKWPGRAAPSSGSPISPGSMRILSPGGYISSTLGTNAAATPAASSVARSFASWRGYLVKSSFGPQCGGWTKIDTTGASVSRFARPTGVRCPAWRA